MVELDAVQFFSSPDWYRALTLSERAAGASVPGLRSPGDDVLAAQRLERWRSQEPFVQDSFFGLRLAQEGIGVEDLRRLLGEPPEALAARSASTADTAKPVWLQEIEDAFTQPRPHPFPRSLDLSDTGPQSGFLEAVRPVLDDGYGRLVAGLRSLPGQGPEDLAPLLARQVPSHLLLLLNRTLVLELYLAGQAGLLSGETPEERFQSFIERLREPAVALELLRQYPVLARQVTETVRRWVSFSLEIVAHLADDRDRLCKFFSPGRDPGKLIEVSTGLGDAHRGGRTVTRLRFESGLGLIYKPRSMAAEAAFQDLLDWTCARGFTPAFRRLQLIDSGDATGEQHGWVELVEAAPCAEAAGIERFYLRQGGYLALLFALSGTDMHSENLIAAGEHPILVDLEALFHPADQLLGQAGESEGAPDTVLRVGFLPIAERAAADQGGADLSGLAAVAGQVLPRPVLRAELAGTDQMRFERRQVTAPVGQHRPSLQGAEVPVASYAGVVEKGFRAMCGLLAAHRDELLAADGPLAAFAAVPVRVVMRPTLAYSGLFVEGQHPYVLGDALDRDRLLDHLWAVVPELPALERLVPAEHRDLTRGDIPLFTTRPDSRDVWSSDGERVPSFLEGTGLERVRERLLSLDAAEIERQAWLVRSSLAAGAPDARGAYSIQPAESPSRDELLAAATAIGRRLEEIAFTGGKAACWFGPEYQGSRWVLKAAGPDLHLGIPGIALFLAHLGAVSGEPRFSRLARAAVVTFRAQVFLDQTKPDSPLLDSIGAFSGWGGILYALTHLGVLWEDESFLDDAQQVAERLAPGIEGDETCDVIAGAAGALVCLLGLYRVRPAQRLLDLTVRCGERILERARPMERGLGWTIPIAGSTPLAGFSHGAAGIAWALLHLAAAVGDNRFRQVALAAIDYERSLFDATEANWPDLREWTGATRLEDPTAPRFLSAWCHGAPGIAIARLDSLPLVKGAARIEMREEAVIAVRTTVATGFGKGHCLCHGDFGNLEAVTLAAETLDDSALAETAGRLAGGILDSARRHGWHQGMRTAAEAPGLMVGLAGIGYGLLRLAAPRSVPSVLRLAPPISA
ncbi:MAG TPA: type 2 lanthipeptide synthetase LanM family protein [Thermoanaerobaculia bacterium]|nr:type 2 lanthipeptide synthetase LanM family protein [Thermoanaerobaculia bacterium]